MTEEKASREICEFSIQLNDTCQRYCSRDQQEIFSIQFRKQLNGMINRLMNLSFRDLEKYRIPNCDSNCLSGHSIRTSLISICLGKALGLGASALYQLGLGAILHDIGKLLLPREILDKPDRLSTIEYEVIKTHSELGYEMVKNEIWLPNACAQIVNNHHERLNGSGYPNNLWGNQIHLNERIVGVADVFDAMTSKRNYRKTLSYYNAYTEVQKESPHLLDHKVVLALGNIIEEFMGLNTESASKLKNRRETCRYPCVK
ncbi:HD-GYP domain-containing protein [Acetobacterium bakii]|uniref:HD-GYP domain-containing protein n=1 Tax=Acetobacterium bakii TaxID=52689 RepID=UPI000680DC35|nr:HD domain-containing phosphohydrolase [Acetobacterium bakii]